MRILYAEDEKQLSVAVAEMLKSDNYEVDAVYDGAEAWERLKGQYYDAVILDIMMPKMDGIQVLKQMRENENYAPVMLLTAKAEIDDRIAGLSVGADDYLGKPFSMGELLARLNAMLRRSVLYKENQQSLGNIMLDCESNELKSDTGGLRLSSKEAQLLSFFIKNRNDRLSEVQIQERLWAETSDKSIVLLYISYLKNKLAQIHSTVNIIQSEGKYFIGEIEKL